MKKAQPPAAATSTASALVWGQKTATGVSDKWFESNSKETLPFKCDLQEGVQYTQSDPIGYAGGMNAYSYAANNPHGAIDPLGLAYFAKRPLQGSRWWGPLSGAEGSGMDYMNCQLSHEQLFFEDGEQPSNLGLFDDGRVRPDRGFPGNALTYHPNPRRFDDCIARMAAQAVTGGYYNLLGIDMIEIGARTGPGPKLNCQDWAAEVRRVYSVLESLPEVRAQCDCEEEDRQRPWWDLSGMNLRGR